MADDRRIITSSSIIPMENADTEEGVTKWAIMRLDLRGESVSKKLGGKDVASVSKEQWGVSFNNTLVSDHPISVFMFFKAKTTVVFSPEGLQVLN